jgi:hypothetical protein
LSFCYRSDWINAQLAVRPQPPSPLRTIWQDIMGEVIGRFIPFLGIADAGRQALEERHTRRQYPATFWLAEARTKAASANKTPP